MFWAPCKLWLLFCGANLDSLFSFCFYFFNDQKPMCSLLQTVYVTLRQTTYLLWWEAKDCVKRIDASSFLPSHFLAKGDTNIFLTETLISYSFTFGKQINEEFGHLTKTDILCPLAFSIIIYFLKPKSCMVIKIRQFFILVFFNLSHLKSQFGPSRSLKCDTLLIGDLAYPVVAF